jgi:hypothetical protein
LLVRADLIPVQPLTVAINDLPVGQIGLHPASPLQKIRPKNPLRANGDLPSHFNVIWVVQPRFQKYSA